MKYHFEKEVIDDFKKEELTIDTFEKLEAFETKLSDYIDGLIDSTFTEGDDELEMFDSLLEAVYINTTKIKSLKYKTNTNSFR